MANVTYSLSTPEVIVSYLTLSFHIISGFLNFFIFYVVHQSAKLHSSAYAFLANACVSDFLLSLIYVLFFIIRKCATLSFIDADILCKLFNYISISACVVSTFTFAAIAVDRYRSISGSLQNQFKVMTDKEIFLSITVIWMSAVILSTPLLILSGTHSDDIDLCDVLPTKPLNEIFFTIMFIILYLLPLLIIVVMYVGIYNMKNHIQPFQDQQRSHCVSDQQSLLFIRMLMTVTGGFMMLTLPIFLFLVFAAYSNTSLEILRREVTPVYYLAWVCYTMAFSVTFINPLLYIVCDKNIRFVVKICVLQLLGLPVGEEFLRQAKLNQTFSRINTRRISAIHLSAFSSRNSWKGPRSDGSTQTSLVM